MKKLRIRKANTAGAYYLRFELAQVRSIQKNQANEYIRRLRQGGRG